VICRNAASQDTGQYKFTVADAVIERLRPIREQFVALRKDERYLDDVLSAGGEKAREAASANWREIRDAIGMRL